MWPLYQVKLAACIFWSCSFLSSRADDKMLMVWDLYPPETPASGRSSVESSGMSSSPPARLQPTAYVIAFPHPLRGSIFLTDWRSDPEENDFESWRLVELIEPHALAASCMGFSVQGGWAAWRSDNPDIVGAVYGSGRYSLWDMSRLQGGKPTTGNSFPQGGHRFRWCPTFPEHFAISTQSPVKGALINIHNKNAQPTTVSLAPRPHFIRDFDWLLSRTPRIAAAVGRRVIVFSVALDSMS